MSGGFQQQQRVRELSVRLVWVSHVVFAAMYQRRELLQSRRHSEWHVCVGLRVQLQQQLDDKRLQRLSSGVQRRNQLFNVRCRV